MNETEASIMKIRTDFVTNSSSSSFILTIKFELDNGETIMWEGKSDVGEGAYEYIQLSARKSPMELGQADSISAMVEMLKESVGEGIKEYEDEEPFKPIFDDKSGFVESLKQISSMEEIRKITIEGYEDTFNDWEDGPEAFDEIVTYDLKTRVQTSVGVGNTWIESEGTGGALDFARERVIKETPEGYFVEKRSKNYPDQEEELF